MARSAQSRLVVRTTLVLVAVLVAIIAGLNIFDADAPALTLTPDTYVSKDGYALTFPRSWRHRYDVTEDGSSMVRVDMRNEGSSQGFPLFVLAAYPEQENLQQLPQLRILARANGRVYVYWLEAISAGTDLSDDQAAQLRDMEKEIPDIISTFRLVSSSQQTGQSPEEPAFGAPFELELRETTTIGELRLTFSETTFPLAGLPPLPPEEDEPYVRLKAEEAGDVLTLQLSPTKPTHHFHDYLIRFADAYDDYVAITVTSAPRGVKVSEEEAVRIALQEAAQRNRSFIGEQGRELRGNVWEIRFLCGLDCGFVVKINATSGSVLGVEDSEGR